MGEAASEQRAAVVRSTEAEVFISSWDSSPVGDGFNVVLDGIGGPRLRR